MAQQNSEQLLLVIDIQANTTRLAEIQKGLNENAAALKLVNDSFKQNKISADEVAVSQVRLRAEASNLKSEQQALTKANTDQIRVLAAEEGSIEQLRAQLSLGTAAYNALSKAQRDNSEEGQRLQAGNKALSDNLSGLEQKIGDFRRSVGQYGTALNDLAPALVKLQEQQKAAAPDSAAYKEVTRQIGFVQKAAEDAGAKMGLSAEQTTAKLNNVAAAIRPATAELVKLEAEQAKVEKGSEAYNQIGFKVNKLNKEIGQAPQALAKVEAASQGVSSGLQSAISKGLAPFQGQIDKVTGTVAKFKSGTELLNVGLASLKGGGETGALGFRAIAAGIAATGIGLLLIAITSLIGYLTSTAEGGKILKQVLAGVGAVVTTLSNSVFEAGKYLTKLFTDPKQVAQDFLEFLKSQVVNRLQAFGVLLDGIRNRDFKKITDSVIQFNLGITNGTERLAAYGKQVRDNAVGMAELEKQMQVLKKSRAELEIDEVKEKGRVEELIRLSKDRTLSSGERLNKLREAGRIETDLSNKALAQTQAELAAIQARNAAKGLSRTSDEIQEERDKRKEYNATVAERNATLATIKARQSRYILEERAERAKANEDRIKDQISATQAELLLAKTGSQEQLDLQQKLTLQKAELEKAALNKTAADRRLIGAQSLTELLKQEDEFLKQRQELVAKQVSQEDAARVTAYNAEKKRQEEAIKDKEADYQHDLGVLERYLDRRRTEIENDYAEGKIDKKAYNKSVELLDQTSFGARIVLAKQYGKDTSKLEADQAKGHRATLVAQREEQRKHNLQMLELAQEFGGQVGDLFAETLQGTGETLQQFANKVLILILDGLQKAVLAEEAKAIAKSIGDDPTPAGLVTAALATAAIEVAFQAAKSAIGGSQAKPFNTGGIIPHDGSPNQDSVYAYLTPGEAVMTRGAVEQFGPVLGHLNALAGGKNFAAPHAPTRVAGQIDGGLMARQLGSQSMPTAAEIGREVGKNVPRDLSVRTIERAKARYDKPRRLTTFNG